jgi:hypothetical protein
LVIRRDCGGERAEVPHHFAVDESVSIAANT